MMYYPTIFPTEFHCQNHLFLVIGNGYEWNKKGQLELFIPSKKQRPGRSRESVISHTDKETKGILSSLSKMFFNPIGDDFTWLYPWSEYSALDYVLRVEIVPAQDWKKAIEWFCYKIGSWTTSDYRKMLVGHYICYGVLFSDRMKQEINSFRKIKKNCEKVLNKLQER